MRIPVILDTDIGSDIDDTWALAMLLRCPELDLKFVLTDTGDTAYRASVTAKFLSIAGRSDIPIGIGLPFEPANEFQRPWIHDYDLQTYAGQIHEDGVQAMIEMIRASTETITIIGIAPAPNLEHALTIAPDIASKCRFVGMFGSVERGYGEGSPPVAETNVREHVAGARKIFSTNWQDIVITPLDTCDQAILSGEWFREIRESDDALMVALMENYKIWSERVTWAKVDFFADHTSTLFDTVAVYLAYSREHLTIETINLHVTDEGMTIRAEEGNAVNVAMSWHNLDGFLEHLKTRLLTPLQS